MVASPPGPDGEPVSTSLRRESAPRTNNGAGSRCIHDAPMTPEQAAILALLDRVDRLERVVIEQHNRIAEIEGRPRGVGFA